MHENEINLKEEFLKICNKKNDKNIKINKETFNIFSTLCQTKKFLYNYKIAEEIVANRQAIFSLDEHITRLMGQVNYLSSEIEKLKIKG
ncbi:MAG: hypothetical protein ACFFG0_04600 [Candidatus Thorarchaeota archaeon]